ncbi:MAG TPA: ABC transporter ATP-binding protein, partial [Synergistaceae bacterium]|nr:ABC transporter ATP-binding protein [Synergistaceae bacterium]
MAALTYRGVSKQFEGRVALSKVEVSVEAGEIFGFIGPDGAGKTTLIRMAMGIVDPDEGTCLLLGSEDRRRARVHAGYVSQIFSLYTAMTVMENISLFGALYGASKKEVRRAGESALRRTGLWPFRDRLAGNLSGGMKQKLALSCALVHQPKVLLLDEPTTGVDPVSRKELWDMLGMLKARGITIIAATPYIDEIRRCERVAYLDKGQLRGIGTAEEILTEYKSVFNPDHLSTVEHTEEKEPVIEVQHLVKTFGTFHAVNDISFSVQRGEIFGFLGANGAGKTTAMRILTGLSQPTAGKGRVLGFDVSKQYEDIKSHIGYMSQRFSLYEDMTVAENLRLFGGIYGMSRNEIKKKTELVLNELGMEQQRDSLMKSLP